MGVGVDTLEDKLSALGYRLFVAVAVAVAGMTVDMAAILRDPLLMVIFVSLLLAMRRLPSRSCTPTACRAAKSWRRPAIADPAFAHGPIRSAGAAPRQQRILPYESGDESPAGEPTHRRPRAACGRPPNRRPHVRPRRYRPTS